MSLIDPLPRLMTFAEWQTGTSLTLHVRSELLRALDREVQQYERNPTVFRLSRVLEALKAWQDSKGPAQAWKKDARNGNGTVSLLDQQLRGLGDSDVAMGAQAFMAPALINARLGVLYLFSNTRTDDSIFKVVLDGAFDLSKDTLGELEDVSGAKIASTALSGAKKPAGMAAAKVESLVTARGGKRVVDSGRLLGDSRPPTDSRLRRAYEWIRTKIEEVGRKIIVMRSFFTQAQVHWAARLERSALHTQPIAFNNWFKRYAIGIPVLSVLALNSGICGDKMHFLAMFKDDSSIVSQTEFDAGVRYVDSLKSWGSEYLKDSGFSFASADPVVTRLLKLATSHTEESGAAGKAGKATLGFLNA